MFSASQWGSQKTLSLLLLCLILDLLCIFLGALSVWHWEHWAACRISLQSPDYGGYRETHTPINNTTVPCWPVLLLASEGRPLRKYGSYFQCVPTTHSLQLYFSLAICLKSKLHLPAGIQHTAMSLLLLLWIAFHLVFWHFNSNSSFFRL